MVKSAEIYDYDVEELETQLAETRRELFNLRFQLATGRLDNFSTLNNVRKDVARMMTELRAREIAEAEGLAAEEIPAHRAAARLRSEDAAQGRVRTSASERRAAAKAADKAAETDDAEDESGDAAVTDAGTKAGAKTPSGVEADEGSDDAASNEKEEG